MHPYSTSESRVKTYAVLAVASVIIAWAIVAATSMLSWPQWLVGAPSVTGVFPLLYRLTDRHMWRWRVFRALGLSTTPDLSGRYEGQLQSTYQDQSGKGVVRSLEVEISQTWTRILVRTAVGTGERTSRSRSVVACVGEAEPTPTLIYHYRNQVNPAVADEDMGDHDGAAEVEIAGGRLEGRYFNSRPRAGSLTAERLP